MNQENVDKVLEHSKTCPSREYVLKFRKMKIGKHRVYKCKVCGYEILQPVNAAKTAQLESEAA